MISSQRIIIMIIMMNVMIGLAGTIYEEINTYDENYFYEDQTLYEKYVERGQNEEPYSGVVSGTDQYETTIGNSLSIGKIIWDVIWNGLNPFSFGASDFDTPIEKTFARMLQWFRTLMGILLIIEGYMIWKNRKSS